MSLLKGSRVLVFGGAGFIGRHLVRRLASLGASVTVYDRSSPDIDGVRFVQGDFSASEEFGDVIHGQQIIYHLVSTTQPATSNADPRFDIQSNLLPTIDMLQAASSSGASKVIFVSSGGTIYGIPESIPIKETHPTNPICSYGIGKLAIEKYLQLFHRLHNLEYVILRMSNPYGPGQLPGKGQGVVAEFVSRAISGKQLNVFGDGGVVRDFIYIADAVDALIAAVEKPVTGIFNIGSGEGVSIRQLIETIKRISAREVVVNYGEARAFDVPSNVLAINHARERLGWMPAVSLEEGIKSIFDACARPAYSPDQDQNGLNLPLSGPNHNTP